MRSPWWRAFSRNESALLRGEDFRDEFAATLMVEDAQYAHPTRGELIALRDIVDTDKPFEPEKPIGQTTDRFCWFAVGVLLTWFAWAVMNAALSAPAP